MAITHSEAARRVAVSVLGAAFLAACGGGAVQSGSVVTGVAQGDAPLAGAAVTLADSSPGVQQRTASTRADGSFSVDVTGLTPPYVVRIEAGAARLHAVAESQDNLDVTPITDLASAYAAGGAGADALLAAPAAQKSAAALRARAILTDLTAEAAPLLNRYGIASLQGDKVRVRRLLQDVTVRRSPGTVTLANKRTGAAIQSFPFPDGSADPGGGAAWFVPGGTFDPAQIPTCFDPGEWDPGQLPTGFDPIVWDPGQLPSNLGPGWDPGLDPSSWADPGKWFDPGAIPSIFDPGKWLDPGQLPDPGEVFDPGQIPSNLGPIGCFDPGQLLPSPGASDAGSWMGSIANLYGSLCGSCHGGLLSSTHRNTTATQVLAKHGNMVTRRSAAGLSAALSDSNLCPGSSSGGTSSGGTTDGSSSGAWFPSSGGWPSSSGGWFPGSSSGASSSSSGGSSSSSGGTTRLPAGHPSVPPGTSCSKCH